MRDKDKKNVLVPGCAGNSGDKLWDAPHSGAEAAPGYLHVNRWWQGYINAHILKTHTETETQRNTETKTHTRTQTATHTHTDKDTQRH